MNKSELTEQVAVRAELAREDAARAIDAFWGVVAETLSSGGEVSLSGFGRFHVGERSARAGVNPRTGERIAIPASRVPRFTAGSALRGAVRGR